MGRYNPEIHHRRSIRFKEYDYSKRGAYFVTMCTHRHVAMFGEIANGVLHCNERGAIVQELWDTLPTRFPGIELDAFIVMPNHVHGILIRTQEIEPSIETHTQSAQSAQSAQLTQSDIHKPAHTSSHTGHTLRDYRTNPHRMQTLNEIVRTFKGITSYTLHKQGTSEFAWQREFYELVIRNQQQLDHFRSYIMNNPTTWLDDKLHPNMENPYKVE